MSMSTEQAKDPPPTIPPQHKKIPWLVLACVAFLLIVLIVGSLAWVLRDVPGGPSTRIHKTPTAITSPRPTWVPTEVTPPAESLFYDTFENNNHAWSLSGDAGFYRILVDHMLILSNTNPNTTLVESVPLTTNLDNYQISADFTLNRGDAHDIIGMYLRGDSTLDHDYRVEIGGNGTIAVTKEWLDSERRPQTTTLAPQQFTNDLHFAGAQNTLTVIMVGPSIAVVLNNYVQIVVTDTSYVSGQIALFAQHGNTSTGVTLSFTRIEVDRLASPLATPTPVPTIPQEEG